MPSRPLAYSRRFCVELFEQVATLILMLKSLICLDDHIIGRGKKLTSWIVKPRDSAYAVKCKRAKWGTKYGRTHVRETKFSSFAFPFYWEKRAISPTDSKAALLFAWCRTPMLFHPEIGRGLCFFCPNRVNRDELPGGWKAELARVIFVRHVGVAEMSTTQFFLELWD